jgi:GGDEF domain-containing protein
VLVNQTEEGAEAFRRRVQHELETTPAPGVEGLDLTMGIAVYPRDGDTPELLLTAADHDLYAQRGIRVGG